MRITKQDFLALVLIFISIIIFFGRLFYPEQLMYITPELGVSDIWQFNFPVKNFLGESLRLGQLPLWNKDMGGGFPLIAEVQIGAFYLPNLLLFYFLPAHMAFNLSYVITFLIAAYSMYFLARYLHRSVVASLLASLSFSLSGFFIIQISHINMIQSAAFLPLVFLLAYLISENRYKTKIFAVVILAIVLAQQIFAGFPQMVFLTLFAVFFYYLLLLIFSIKNKTVVKLVRPFLILIAGIILALLISAIQLLPTLELTKLSQRSQGLNPQEVLFYSFKPVLFKTFINPFALGSPKDGTYPDYTKYDGAIFWENTGYVGILPLILALISVFLLYKNKHVLFFSLLLILSILLMLGKNSPLYVILLFPPVSFFRIHSRFILLVVMSLSILSAFGLDYIRKSLKFVSAIVAICIVLITYLDIMKIWFSYHATAKVETWLAEPETVSYLNSIPHGRIFSLNRFSLWKYYFLTYGWTKPDVYFSARSALHPNLNLIYNIPQSELYSALYTRRWMLFNGLVQTGLQQKQLVTSLASPSAKLLSANNVTHIIATSDFKDPQFTKVFETENKIFEYGSLAIFENKKGVGRAYFTTDYHLAKTVSAASDLLTDSSFIPGQTVVIEKEIDLKADNNNNDPKAVINTLKDEHQNYTIEVDTPTDGLLVVSDSYYPGWKVYVDGQEREILAANLNHRAVLVKKGKHVVEFKYQSDYFKKGVILSLAGIIFTVFLVLYQLQHLPGHISSGNVHSSLHLNNSQHKAKRAVRKRRQI